MQINRSRFQGGTAHLYFFRSDQSAPVFGACPGPNLFPAAPLGGPRASNPSFPRLGPIPPICGHFLFPQRPAGRVRGASICFCKTRTAQSHEARRLPVGCSGAQCAAEGARRGCGACVARPARQLWLSQMSEVTGRRATRRDGRAAREGRRRERGEELKWPKRDKSALRNASASYCAARCLCRHDLRRYHPTLVL